MLRLKDSKISLVHKIVEKETNVINHFIYEFLQEK